MCLFFPPFPFCTIPHPKEKITLSWYPAQESCEQIKDPTMLDLGELPESILTNPRIKHSGAPNQFNHRAAHQPRLWNHFPGSNSLLPWGFLLSWCTRGCFSPLSHYLSSYLEAHCRHMPLGMHWNRHCSAWLSWAWGFNTTPKKGREMNKVNE